MANMRVVAPKWMARFSVAAMCVGGAAFSAAMSLGFAGAWVAPAARLIETAGVAGFFLALAGALGVVLRCRRR